jgi:hypothetical protein
MGGFNAVLSGLGRGAALAQLIRQQAIADAQEQRAKENYEREKAIQESDFTVKAREIGGRAPTGGDIFQRASGQMLTPKDRVEVDPQTGRRTVIPGFGVAASDIKSRMIKSPGGQEFVLPTKAEQEAEQRRRAREAFQSEVLKKQVFGDIEAGVEGKKTGAKKRAEEPFAAAADRRKAALEEAKAKADAAEKATERTFKSGEGAKTRTSQEKRVAAQQAGAAARTQAMIKSREAIAAMQAEGRAGNIDKEVKELEDLIFEIEQQDIAIANGIASKKLKGPALEIEFSKQERRLGRHNQVLDIIGRKNKLASGGTGTKEVNKLKGKQGGGDGPSDGLRVLEGLLK